MRLRRYTVEGNGRRAMVRAASAAAARESGAARLGCEPGALAVEERIPCVAWRRAGDTKRIAYFCWRYRGRRYHESLQTDDPDIARERARAKRRAIEEENWQTLDRTRAQRSCATIEQVLEAYLDEVRLRGAPRRPTAVANAAALRRVVAAAGVGMDRPAAELTAQLVRRYVRGYMGEEMESEGRRRSCASELRQARSVVGADMLDAYRERGLDLPDLGPFARAFGVRAAPVEWTPPEPKIIEPIIAAAAELTEGSALRLAWVLGYHVAMRASEIAAARWSWVRDGWLTIAHDPETGYRPKGVSGSIPLHPDIAAEIGRARAGVGYRDYILPGAATARLDVVKRDLATWMRARGWTRRHCAHELRAYRIHLWRQAYGLDVARDWARHGSAALTARHYSTNRNSRAEPIL
ncbi:MAG TPA: hypothetical protein PK406_08175 [Verrucomicrobiota bacterium]|nr:hypothetical protein [Verrucomicrobiota bacterium]